MSDVSRAPLILLPPSEAKMPGGRGAPWAPGRMRFGDLDEARTQVIGALDEALRDPAIDPAALFGVSGEALDRAREAGSRLLTSATTTAFRRYTGVLYGALDPSTLDAASKRRAARQVIIVSGLFGLVAPSDPIPDYRLKMGVSLPPLGSLATWWRPRLSAALAPVVAGRVVWDLLPAEHRAAWSPDASTMEARLRVRFLDNRGSSASPEYAIVSHWNKLLKGALVRHILETQLRDPRGLTEFDHPEGYRYEPSLTNERAGATEIALVR